MSKALWNAAEAAAATEGKTSPDWQATSVAIDSRQIKAGALYVAIKGERVDGHEFVKQALENGAVAAMVHQPVDGVDSSRLLVVEDTFKGLQALAIAARARSQAHIIGVTGSVGKTTTKEALRHMCEAFGRTHASLGNLNNHYGTPLSLANMPADAEFGVFEMGMNHAGEIRPLTRMVRPHVAIITTVEAVHLEFFENQQAIAKAKAEIFEGLEPGGVAVLNADNSQTNFIKNHASLTSSASSSPPSESFPQKRESSATGSLARDPRFRGDDGNSGDRLLMFGKNTDADIQLLESDVKAQGELLKVKMDGSVYSIQLSASGIAAISAALVCLSVAQALGLDIQKAIASLAEIEEVKGRGRVESVLLNGKSMWWIDDSYNASPASMRAAFEKLALVKKQKNAARSVAVLGDMLELGPQSAALHAGLALDIHTHNIDEIYSCGVLMQHLNQALGRGQHFADLSQMQRALKDQLQAGDVVLFKGSNGSQIHQLVKDLKGLDTTN